MLLGRNYRKEVMRIDKMPASSAKYDSVLGFVKLVECACLIQGNPVRECEQRQFFPDTVGHEPKID